MLPEIASGTLSHTQAYQHMIQHNWYEKAHNFLYTFMQMQPCHNGPTIRTVLVGLLHQTMCQLHPITTCLNGALDCMCSDDCTYQMMSKSTAS